MLEVVCLFVSVAIAKEWKWGEGTGTGFMEGKDTIPIPMNALTYKIPAGRELRIVSYRNEKITVTVRHDRVVKE